MKRIFLFALVSIVSCTKTNTPEPSLSITGRWELRESIGGFAGDLKYVAGNGYILQFNMDLTFKIINPSMPPDVTGKYKLVKFISDSQSILHFKYDSSYYADETDTAKIENNQLIISSPPQCCDIPYKTIYEKLR